MAKEAEASVRKRKAGDDPGVASIVGDEGEASTIPEASFSEVDPKSSEVAFTASSNPSDSFVFEDEYNYMGSCVDDADILRQYSDIRAQEAAKIPYVGDKEPLSSLAAEFQSGSPILQEKIKLLDEQYTAIRRTRGMEIAFIEEHILETQDRAEVNRVFANIELCKKTLQGLGYADFTFEDFFSIFIEQLESVLQGSEASISQEELLNRSRDQSISDYVVMFFRFVTSGEIRRRAEFFEPFIAGLSNTSVDQFCKASVEPMGEESDHVHIIALSDALGVPIRVVYLDRSSCDSSTPTINHHDFLPSEASAADPDHLLKPRVTLLYRPGHYDILYPKQKTT